MSNTQTAADAVAYIDGTQVTSDMTGVQKDVIPDFVSQRSGVVSDKDGTGALTANKLTIETDGDAMKDQVNKFIASYNVLLGSLTSLGKRSTIVGGEKPRGWWCTGRRFLYLFNSKLSLQCDVV